MRVEMTSDVFTNECRHNDLILDRVYKTNKKCIALRANLSVNSKSQCLMLNNLTISDKEAPIIE